MSNFLKFLLIVPIAFGQQSQDIVRCIEQAKDNIFVDKYPLMVFYSRSLDDRTQAAVNQFLATSIEPFWITNSVNSYESNAAFRMHSVAFIEDVNDLPVMWQETANRKILILRKDNFRDASDRMIRHQCFHVVYVVCGEASCEMFHYIQYLKQLNKYDGSGDPIFESTRNLAGSSVAHIYGQELDEQFFKMVVRMMNSTFDYGGFMFAYAEEGDLRDVTTTTNLVYMHRDTNYRVLVPKLNQAVPWVYVLTDPYDIYTWMMFFNAVISVALFRSILSIKFSVRVLVRSISNIFGTVILGTQIEFKNEIERQVVGLFLLLNVVLINAYQSLVISFLLSPRMYPELDTMDQLNDSCYWNDEDILAAFNFKHVDEITYDAYMDILSVSWARVQSLHAHSHCAIVDSWMANELSKGRYNFLLSNLFRWSALTVLNKPLLAVAVGDPEVARRVTMLASMYFAEGGFFETDWTWNANRKFHSGIDLKPTEADEILLVWMILSIGLTISGIVFAFEIINSHRIAKASKVKTTPIISIISSTPETQNEN